MQGGQRSVMLGDRPGRASSQIQEGSGPDLALWAYRLWERTFSLFRPPDMDPVRPAAAHTHQDSMCWLIGNRKQQGSSLMNAHIPGLLLK